MDFGWCDISYQVNELKNNTHRVIQNGALETIEITLTSYYRQLLNWSGNSLFLRKSKAHYNFLYWSLSKT